MGKEIQNPLRVQSKYGLMEYSVKTGKKLSDGHRSKQDVLFVVQNIKVPFGIEPHPPTHQTWSICVQDCSGVPNLQTELNYLDSFNTYCDFSDLGFFSSDRVGQVGGGYLG